MTTGNQQLGFPQRDDIEEQYSSFNPGPDSPPVIIRRRVHSSLLPAPKKFSSLPYGLRKAPKPKKISPPIDLCQAYMDRKLDEIILSSLSIYLTNAARHEKKVVVPRGADEIFKTLDAVYPEGSPYWALKGKYLAMQAIRDHLLSAHQNPNTESDSPIDLIKNHKKETFAEHRTGIFPRSFGALLAFIVMPSLLLTKWFTGYWLGDLFTTDGEQTCDKLLAMLEKPAAESNASAPSRRLCY